MSKGDTITSYAGPTPPHGTHRYIFNVYEQVGGWMCHVLQLHAKTACVGMMLPAACTIHKYFLVLTYRCVISLLFLLLLSPAGCAQPEGVRVPKTHIEQRARFSASDWAKRNGMSGIPVATVHFVTKAGHEFQG